MEAGELAVLEDLVDLDREAGARALAYLQTHDPDSDVRIRAAEKLLMIGRPGDLDVGPLLAILTSDRDLGRRLDAADCLGLQAEQVLVMSTGVMSGLKSSPNASAAGSRRSS